METKNMDIEKKLGADFEQKRDKSINEICEYLKTVSPAARDIPLNCDGPTGWVIYIACNGNKETSVVYADGVYCGFSGKQKIFYMEDEIKEVDNFYILGTKESIYIKTYNRQVECNSLKRVGYAEYRIL